MTTTFAELRTAVADRGFTDLTTAQLGQLVNDACVELDSAFLWPYREASVTGVAPVAIADLGTVDEVIDGTTNCALDRANWDELVRAVGDVSLAGTPLYWYLAAPAGSTTIGTFPTGTGQVEVQYWRTTPVLTADSDEPLCPVAWRGLLVDIAAGAAYPDGETPPGLQARIDRRLGLMVNALMADYGRSEVMLDGVDG